MIRTHRVGTITLGGSLIAFGILFLLHIFMVNISYHMIFKIWPAIFIFLGIEILVANFRQKEEKIIYDKTAFFLIILLTFFAMGMALIQLGFESADNNLTVIW